MDNWKTKQISLFLIICFGGTYLMGVLLACAYFMRYNTTSFASVQMLYPAAATIVVLLITNKRENLPIKFFEKYLVTTVLSMLCLFIGVVTRIEGWINIVSVLAIGGSIWCWWALWRTETHLKDTFGLTFVNKRQSYVMICCFGALVVLRQFIYGGIQGDWNVFETSFTKVFIGLVMLLPNFFLSFISFFGEEYGWRYYLQPLLQKRFGNRLGVILLGSIWGIWHLPLECFHYFSPELSGWGVLNRQMICISVGVFFAYAYMRTKNIWVPVILHFMNNNLMWIININDINTELSPGKAVLQTMIPSMIVFFPFIFSRVFSVNDDSKKKNITL